MDFMQKGTNFVLGVVLFFIAFFGLWLLVKQFFPVMQNEWIMVTAAILAGSAVAGK